MPSPVTLAPRLLPAPVAAAASPTTPATSPTRAASVLAPAPNESVDRPPSPEAHLAPRRTGSTRAQGAALVRLLQSGAAARPRVVHFSVRPEERQIMDHSALAGFDNVFVGEPLSDKTAHLAAGAAVVTTFVHDRVDAAVLQRLQGVGAIAQRATGFDNIDLAAARKAGIKIFNVPEYGSRTVAEYGFALLLALMRKLDRAYERTERGDFRIDGLMGHDLFGKRLVIIGGGRIGKAAAEMGRGFGMSVVVVDPYHDDEAARRLGYRYDSLDNALPHADVVSIHCGLSAKTEHLLDAAAFAKLKHGAVLINTARGPIVDTAALLAALRSGRLAGAGLDTFEGEKALIETQGKTAGQPLIEALRLRDDVILTPHVAFSSREALGRIMSTTAQNIGAAAWGGTANRVDVPSTTATPRLESLRILGERLDAWLTDRQADTSVRQPLGRELSAAWDHLVIGNEPELRAALARLAERCVALGVDGATVAAMSAV